MLSPPCGRRSASAAVCPAELCGHLFQHIHQSATGRASATDGKATRSYAPPAAVGGPRGEGSYEQGNRVAPEYFRTHRQKPCPANHETGRRGKPQPGCGGNSLTRIFPKLLRRHCLTGPGKTHSVIPNGVCGVRKYLFLGFSAKRGSSPRSK
jgi:hypothetical protein